MIGLGRPHHSATGFSQRLFYPSLAFMAWTYEIRGLRENMLGGAMCGRGSCYV
ncbi:hypothetical protein MTR_5g093180 [Medicago truncatula]|uniref:Uncharacterized protein n=1 Tax=Medicago truncatula TaxID=3880 RepID=G7K3K9_MEDTR|nr:hypothetical protein MTR_5g093180 [Medicago truncatula]